MQLCESLIRFFLNNNEPIKFAEQWVTEAQESLNYLEYVYGVRFCKEFVVRNSDHSDSWIRVVNNSSEDYSETESVNGEIVPGKSKFNEFSFNQINLFSTNQFDPINCCSNSCSTSALKKQIVTKHSDDSLNNVPLTCGTVETGPFLRKKLNFNMKSNKHKTKKYISSSSEIQQSLV